MTAPASTRHPVSAPVDAVDRRIIAATQAGLPICRDPYGAVAAQVGLSRGEIMVRMREMLAKGVIRRIGAVPNHYALGFPANGMAVWDVSDDRIAALGETVGALKFVTHCYWRPRHPPLWPFNLFTMVHGRDRAEVESKVAEISGLIGPACRQSAVLYSTRILKKTGLRLTD